MDRLLQTLTTKSLVAKEISARNLLAILERTGAFDYCKRKIDEHLNQAVKSISILKDTQYKSHLTEMTKALEMWGR